MSMCSEPLSDQARYAELIRMLRPDYPFVQLGFHFGEAAAPTSRTMRVTREGKHLIKKEYLGQLSGKTEQEIGLLMAAAWKGLQHTASFKTVHAMTCNLNDAGEADVPQLELLMKNYGLDLEDWFFLFHQAGVPFLDSPYLYLALWHYVLLAMKELHQANFVQVDVKPDNICVALPEVSTCVPDSAQIALRFDLSRLTLIDLGEALHPDLNKRVLLFHANGMALGPGNSYISQHYKKCKALVRPHDMKPLRCLDWRVDFHALGCMVDDWTRTTQFSAAAPDYLEPAERRSYAQALDLLHRLPTWLKSADTDPSNEAGDLPHDRLIAQIGKVLNLEKWTAPEITLPVRLDKDLLQDVAVALTVSHPQQYCARETLLAAAPDLLLKKQSREEAPVRRSRHEPLRQQSGPATHEADAVKWYRNSAPQTGRLPPGVDLLC